MAPLLIRPTSKENVGRIRRSRRHPTTPACCLDGAYAIRPTTTTFIRQ
ncbi:hypothetical protein KCP77_24285 [Salmonella enterica subsp. enterica]|nr:hypothetical protein KCP77_24285 [Salmonella enterica subsp. enterica]